MEPIHAHKEDVVETSRWESRHPALLGRLAGVAGAAYVVLALAPGSLGGPQYGSSMSTPQILAWVTQHTGSFPVTGFTGGLSTSVFALFLLLLLAVARGRGLLSSIVVSAAAALMAIDWVATGVYYALADAAGRQQATGGIVALFSLNNSMTYVDGFVAGLAILALSLLQFGPHALPRPLIWLGALAGTYHIVSGPIQLAVSHSPAGATGPIGVVLLLLWVLAVAAVMLIKPAWSASQQPALPATGTSPASEPHDISWA
jgi:hypothetical protein